MQFRCIEHPTHVEDGVWCAVLNAKHEGRLGSAQLVPETRVPVWQGQLCRGALHHFCFCLCHHCVCPSLHLHEVACIASLGTDFVANVLLQALFQARQHGGHWLLQSKLAALSQNVPEVRSCQFGDVGVAHVALHQGRTR